MKKPTMTLAEIERALAVQDRDLQAAYHGLAKQGAASGVAVPAGAVERLEQACSTARDERIEPRASHGIRC